MGSPKSLITMYTNTMEHAQHFKITYAQLLHYLFFILFGNIVICRLEDSAVTQSVHQQNEAAQYILAPPYSTVCC